MIDLKSAFDKHDKEFLEFDRVAEKLHPRPDVCAFLLLDKLVPSSEDIVSAAEHDEIFLGVDCEKLARAATDDDIVMLTRCGVRYSEEYECLAMFV